MQIRPMQLADLDQLADVDGTIESLAYLHLNEAGESPLKHWHLEERPLRQKRIDPNAISDEARFILKQIVSGADEGLALAAEHDERIVGLLAAQPDLESNLLRLIDLRVDYDFRRQGLASAMLFQAIHQARQEGRRAVSIQTQTDNQPVNALLTRLHFELSGVDTHRRSNHDLVEEAVALFWYIPLSQ